MSAEAEIQAATPPLPPLSLAGGPHAAAAAALRVWLQRRRPFWLAAEQDLRAARRQRIDPAHASRLLAAYRGLARDVAVLRERLPQDPLHAQVEALYRALHEHLQRDYEPPGPRLVRLYTEQVPEAMRRLRNTLAAVVAWFLLSAAAGFVLVRAYPELAGLFLSDRMIDGVQQGHLWTESILNVAPSAVVSARIFTNNITVSITAYALGLLYGLGTLYLIGLNGAMLGVALAYTARFGLAGALLRFIVAHGLVELSVICIAGASGARLGAALARPAVADRGAALREAAAWTSRPLWVCVPFLIGCGLIEGYVSPDDTWPTAARLAIGLGYAGLFAATLSGRLPRWLLGAFFGGSFGGCSGRAPATGTAAAAAPAAATPGAAP
jgi:uncharacterized membrane protein SpoIIM required for sporulation